MKKKEKGNVRKRTAKFLASMLCVCMVFQTIYLPAQAQEVALDLTQETEELENQEELQGFGLETEMTIETENETESGQESELQLESEINMEDLMEQPISKVENLTADNSLEDVRNQASQNFADGSNTEATGVDLKLADHVFDGTEAGVIDYTTEEFGGTDSAYLRVLNNLQTKDFGGSIILKFKTSKPGILFGAGSTNTDDGNNMVFGINGAGELRAYFRNDKNEGLKARLLGGKVNLADNQWHTIAVSFHSGKAENAYVVVDGGENVYNTSWWPSWNPGFNKSVKNAALPYVNFQIGGGVYNSSSFESLGNFTGEMEFVTVTEESFSIEQMQNLTTGSDVPQPDEGTVFQKSEVEILNGEPTEPIDYGNALEGLKDLSQGTVTVRYKTGTSGIMSLFSVSNNTQRDTHTHLYINGNTVGYEVRNNAENLNSDAAAVPELAKNEWHTLTYVFTSTGTRVYCDGDQVLNNQKPGFISGSQGTNTVDLGKTDRSSGGNNYPFSGRINYIEVRSDILTEAEIMERQKVTIREEKEVEVPEDVVKTEDNPLFYGGYQNSVSYRIPSLLTTKDGVVLAAIDKRQSGEADQGNIDTAVRRSYDGGKNWTEGQTVMNLPVGGTQAALTIDSVMVQDEVTGRIFIMADMFPESQAAMNSSLLEKGSGYKKVGNKSYCILRDYESVLDTTHNYTKTYTIREHGEVWLEGETEADARPTEYTVPEFSNGTLYKDEKPVGNIFLYTGKNAGELKVVRNMRIWSSYSDDNGETWSEPEDLTAMIKDEWMLFCGTGPGVGIQVKNGAHKGRLVVPIYVANGNGSWTSSQASASIYSDDHGVTWKRTKVSPLEAAGINLSEMNNGGAILTESQILEMDDGTLIQFCRNASGKLKYSTSKDSGTTWSAPITDSNVPEVYCQLTAVHYPEKIDGKEAVILANPEGPARNDGMVRIGLYNSETKSFEWKYQRLVHSGPYSYSCLSVLPNGDLGLFYEAPAPTMNFTSFNIQWIKMDMTAPMEEPVITDIKMEKKNDQIEFTVEFDSYIIKTGNPVLKFEIDGIQKEAAYVSGNATKTFVFRYEGNTEINTGLTVTNVGVADTDTNSEIGNTKCLAPLDGEFKFAADGSAMCTCKIEELEVSPKEIMIPHEALEFSVELAGKMKESTCSQEGHIFNPSYTYELKDAGTTGAVLEGNRLKVTQEGTAKIAVTAELNGKTGTAVCEIKVTRAESGETVNQAPAAKSPVPMQEVDSLLGKSFRAGDIAEDPEGDEITITKIVSDPEDFVLAELSNGEVTLYGARKGTSRMLVNVSDGKLVSTIVVPVSVTEAGSYDKTDYLSDHDYLDVTQSTVGYGTIKVDTNMDGGRITLLDEKGNQVGFDKGYGAHCTSSLLFNLPKGHTYKTFESYFGVDASKPPVAAVTFKITVDEKVVYTSDQELQSTSPMGFAAVDITGASTLKLEAIAENIGSGHSEWAGARLTGAAQSVEKTALEERTAEAAKFQEKDYSPASFAALTEALNHARTALQGEAEQLDIFKHLQAINAAIKGLQKAVPANQIAINHKELSLEVGDSQKLYADLYAENGKISNDQVIWTTNKPEVAKVSSTGKVTAVGAGKAVITATSTSGRSDICKVFVKGCSCQLSTPVFGNQTVQIPYKEAASQLTLQAEAVLSGDCMEEGHAGKQITYTYKIQEDKMGIGSLEGNKLTVSGEGTLILEVTASVNDKSTKATASVVVIKEAAPAPVQYEAVFQAGEGATGTAPKKITVGAENRITLPANTFTKTGYQFVGWFDGSKVYKENDTYVMPAKNITFTARWEKQILEKPGKPSGLKASQNKSTSIKISWKAAQNATGYLVYRYNSASKKWKKIKTTTSLSYRDTRLKAGYKYKYKVKSYSQLGSEKKTGAYSATITTVTAPGKPKLIRAKKSGKRTAILKWTKKTGMDGVIIYMKANKGDYKKIASVSGKKTSYIKKGLKKGKTYIFKIKGYKKVGSKRIYSAYSNSKKVKF